jgi:anti-sigma factor RsiW
MSDHGMEKSLISAYCDGELNAIELAEAEQLLETSEEARAELQSYRNLTNLLQDNARPTFRVNLAASVLQAIQPQAVVAQSASATTVASGRSTSHDSTSPHFNTNRKSVRLWTVVAASAACLAMMVWVGLNRGGRPQLANHEQPQSTEKSVVTNSAASGFSAESSKTSEVTVARVEPQPKTGTTAAQVGAKPVTTLVDTKVAKPLQASQLPVELIADLKNSNVGQIQRFIRQNKDGVTVFHLMVMDLKPGMASLEMILSAQQISAVDGKPVNDRADVVAVYIEANQDKMDSLVQQIKQDHEKFLALAVQKDAMPSAQMASLTAKKTSDATTASQAIPVNAGELQTAGVEPLKSEQIAMAHNERGHRSSRPPVKALAQNVPGSPQLAKNPTFKLLILVEQATPESLLSQPAAQKN